MQNDLWGNKTLVELKVRDKLEVKAGGKLWGFPSNR